MSDDEGGGLFCIAIDDSDQDTKAKPRDHQTEEDFRKLRATYRVKEQNGVIWQTLELPLKPNQATKSVLQEVLHAVEELYFLRRFEEAAAFARRVLDGSEAALDRDTRELLGRYEEKCRGRMGV